MTAIENLKKLQRDYEDAQAWLGLIGSPYCGGGGGVGELKAVDMTAVVYHQPSDGATNYHDIPKILAQEIAALLKNQFTDVSAQAMKNLSQKINEARIQAIKEHESLLREAGIEV